MTDIWGSQNRNFLGIALAHLAIERGESHLLYLKVGRSLEKQLLG